ncbi:glutamic acid-rich protein-like [Neolamprologus brichardi]|uniref:glutamic acid-rich protein-like n=1 Tax=Neolamprologus brichardi TaxID=32507 RepID=UPI0016439066|nr:glutamic acid-rich protein-like [Neolamprologus brichardi]
MWDTKSRFTGQTSAWCGMASVSGSGFLSKVSTSSAGGSRQNDPGLRRWQSLSHLGPESPTRSLGAELRAARDGSSFRQTEVVHRLQEAHQRLESKLDWLKTRDMLSYNTAIAQLPGRQLPQMMKGLEDEKKAAVPAENEKSRQCRELCEKVLNLEKDLLQMRSALDRGSIDQSTERAPCSLNRTLPVSQEKQKGDTEMLELREALKEAETKAKTLEEERNKALQQLRASIEMQRTLLSQIEETDKKLSHTAQDHSELQKELSEANNKISQACLEKAILSTQVLKLEDNIKEIKSKLTEALQEKTNLLHRVQVLEMQTHNKQQQKDVVVKEDSQALREENEKIRGELEMIKKRLEISHHELQELTDEKIINTKQVTDLEVRCSQLIREKEELQSEIKGRLEEMQEKCCEHRESVEVLELENQKLRNQCLRLEDEVFEKEKREEEYRKQDVVKVQTIEELKAVASHWTEKWQKVALTLQSTQEELEELKKNSRNKGGCDSLLRDELEKPELERSRSQACLHRDKDKGKGEGRQIPDKGTETCLSESSLLWDSESHPNKSLQVSIQSSEVQRLKQKLADKENELSEKEHALKTLERLREMEKNEAKIKISALELKLMKKVPEDGQDQGSLLTDIFICDSEEIPGKVNQILPSSKLQTQRQFYEVEDGKPSVQGQRGKTVCPLNVDTEQQRRLVTEQLKSLFKEREGKEAQQGDSNGASSPQDWTPTVKHVRAAVDRRNWQQASGLMPVFEEDEEEINGCPAEEEEEGEAGEETHDENLLDQKHEVVEDLKQQQCWGQLHWDAIDGNF